MQNHNSGEIPLGLGMALAQNPQAMKVYAEMNKTAQQEILARAHQVSSKREMQRLVAELAQGKA